MKPKNNVWSQIMMRRLAGYTCSLLRPWLKRKLTSTTQGQQSHPSLVPMINTSRRFRRGWPAALQESSALCAHIRDLEKKNIALQCRI